MPEPVAVLEFEIDAAETDRMLRLPAIASRRQGRPKTVSVEMIWHDTPGRDLARQGLALAEQHGTWRLERLVPNGVTDWLPASPAPVLAQAASPQALGRLVPAELMPIAGFTGRRRQYGLLHATGAARLTVLQGALRGLTAEKPACRLIFSGDKVGMASLATELAADMALSVPCACLAADAMALAQGRTPAPRHLGAPEVPPDTSVESALIIVTAHLADVILHWAPMTRPGAGPEPVHQMRVAVRRLRSALSVFRRAAGGEECAAIARSLKALAALLGAARDWDVFLSGTGAEIRAAFPHDTRVAGLLAAAGRKRQAAYAALAAWMATKPWRDLALAVALLPTQRPWQAGQQDDQAAILAAPAAAYAAQALHRRLRHVLAAGDGFAELAPEDLHAVRKQAKRLRYAAEFFTPLFPGKGAKRFLGRLEDLQEALGAVNDAAVAACLMAQLGGGGREHAFASGVVHGFVAAGSAGGGARAAHAWKKLRDAESFWT